RFIRKVTAITKRTTSMANLLEGGLRLNNLVTTNSHCKGVAGRLELYQDITINLQQVEYSPKF
ncbi:hypothetical protein, partial [Thermovibrio ammonificans]